MIKLTKEACMLGTTILSFAREEGEGQSDSDTSTFQISDRIVISSRTKNEFPLTAFPVGYFPFTVPICSGRRETNRLRRAEDTGEAIKLRHPILFLIHIARGLIRPEG